MLLWHGLLKLGKLPLNDTIKKVKQPKIYIDQTLTSEISCSSNSNLVAEQIHVKYLTLLEKRFRNCRKNIL